MPLTNNECRNAKPAAKPYKLSDSRGLYLQIMPNGSKYWRFKYRFVGKEKVLALGVYPDVTVAQARDKREAARKQLADIIDPAALKRERKIKAALNATVTFELVAREWHEQRRERWTPGHAADVIHRLECDVFPRLGKRPVNEITPPELLACLRKIEERGAMELARRARQVSGQVFRYAIATGRAERNPADPLIDALKAFERGHFAAIEVDELPDFVRALARYDSRLYPLTRAAVSLLLLTFVRTGELIGAQWDEISFDKQQWLIPAERMKMRRPHVVPLSRQTLKLLHELHELTSWSRWVFPNQARPLRHMSNGTILKALKNMGYQGRMTGHGFRALAMSAIKEKLG